jgi:hypothetical protein
MSELAEMVANLAKTVTACVKGLKNLDSRVSALEESKPAASEQE